MINYPYLYNDNCITTLLNHNDERFITDLILDKELKEIKFNYRDYLCADTVAWFKDYIEKFLEIDLFEYSFDKEKGYSNIDKNNISIFYTI